MSKKELVSQTKIAFDLIQKLYLEVSYLIKETEGLLAREEENFLIGRPSGYAINYRGSSGLESSNVSFWLMRNLSVFFVAEANTETKGGQTYTQFGLGSKIIYLRICLDGRNLPEPLIYSGVLYDFMKKSGNPKLAKIEQVMAHIEYRESQVFKDPACIDYEDGYLKFKGKLNNTPLYDINSSQELVEKIINPALALYRAPILEEV